MAGGAGADTERMEAVKRAYAEIILNTAAESAARILASERKASAFQRSLAAAKHDALHMLLRLKSLMDAKLSEAETRNILHARRIQELESQLHHAHSIISSLQARLHDYQPHSHSHSHSHSPQHPHPTPPQQQQDNTTTYYNNLLATDHHSTSTSSVNLLLSTATTIPTHHASKVRSRNRCTQRVLPFDHSKHPKVTGPHKYKKSKEIAHAKAFFRRDPPRRSRTKSNYVKISKFGMKIDADVPQNPNKVSHKCIEKVNKQSRSNLGPGSAMGHHEDPVGLELIADNIHKEDNKSALAEPALDLIAVDSKPAETKPYSQEPEAPVPDLIAQQALTSVTEPESLPSIKYTFRRKRKRVTSENNNEGFSAVVPVLEENKDGSKSNYMCNKDDDGNNEDNKEDNCLEASENQAQELKLRQGDEGLVSDSAKSRSNRRLVQVARQLISLSTKKW